MSEQSIASLVFDYCNRRKGEKITYKIMFAELGLTGKAQHAARLKVIDLINKKQIKRNPKIKGELRILKTFGVNGTPKRRENSKPKSGFTEPFEDSKWPALDKRPVILPEIAANLERLQQARNAQPLNVNEHMMNILAIHEQNILQRQALEQIAIFYDQLGQLLLAAGIIEHD